MEKQLRLRNGRCSNDKDSYLEYLGTFCIKEKNVKIRKKERLIRRTDVLLKVNRKLCMTSNKGQRETDKVVVDPESATFRL
jgi:hypothetical protein